MNTVLIVENLIQTLDVEKYFEEVEELDWVDQRQCARRALRALGKSSVLALHGQNRVREAMYILHQYLG